MAMRIPTASASVRWVLVGLMIAPLSCRSLKPAAHGTDEAADIRPPVDTALVDAIEPPPIEAGLAPPAGPYAPGFDALHYDVVLQLPDTGSFLRGVTTAEVFLEAPRRDTLALDFSGLYVESVDWNAEPLSHRHVDGRLLVPVPPRLRAGDTLKVDVTYRGHPDDGLILGRNVHGEPTAFADNWPNRARFWFPSIDHPSDKASVRFIVNAGAERRVIANGSLRGEGAPPVWIWENDEPIPTYTMVIAAADFVVDELGTVCIDRDRSACTEVTTWLFPPDTAAAAPSFRRAADMVAYFNDLIAPFPYAKLAHVQASTRFGGMENVTAIFYPEHALAEGRDIEVTVAHETAHQWFGDAVTESDWHHLWLSEGFATYFAALYFEAKDGVERFRQLMEEERQGYVSSGVAGLPMVDPDQKDLFALLNANNYNKGAWVLHMLRGMLGDDAFFEGIRAYYAAHEHATALSADLRRAFEAASGTDLSGFFDRWVYEPGYPQYDVEWSWSAEKGLAEVRIEQVQPSEWGTFSIPLAVDFTTSTGTIRRRVPVDGRTTTATVEINAEPTSVVVDPDGDVLKEVVRVARSGL